MDHYPRSSPGAFGPGELKKSSFHSQNKVSLTFIAFWANSEGDKFMIFFLFSQNIGFGISCKSPPNDLHETSVKSYFLEKKRKNISKCHLLNFLPSKLSVKTHTSFICLLEFYDPANTVKVMLSWSVHQYLCTLSPVTDNCPSWISGRERMTVENILWSISMEECCQTLLGSNLPLPDHQSDVHLTEPSASLFTIYIAPNKAFFLSKKYWHLFYKQNVFLIPSLFSSYECRCRWFICIVSLVAMICWPQFSTPPMEPGEC